MFPAAARIHFAAPGPPERGFFAGEYMLARVSTFCISWRLLLLFFLFPLSSCTGPLRRVLEPGAPQESARALRPVRPQALPEFWDDLEGARLLDAVRQSLDYFERQNPDRRIACGPDAYPAATMCRHMEKVAAVLEGRLDGRNPWKTLATISRAYQGAAGRDGRVLFTAYYEPVLEGSRKPDPRYPVPLYRPPDDLKSRRPHRPYLTRHEIDRLGRLAGKGYEILWLKDPIEAFFLHIQGSGKVLLEDGSSLRVRYAANNGRSYKSIGEVLIRSGRLQPGEASAPSIKEYLRTHPDERDKILDANERYIFFEAVEDKLGPRGSLGVSLTEGRSIAADPAYYPRGALAWIETEVPVLGEDGRLEGWRPLRRFVLIQDAGGAIQGPARADIFWGSGERAGLEAGYMRREGRLFVLAPRDP